MNVTVTDTVIFTYKPAGELIFLDQVTIAGWALAGLLANGLASVGATGPLQGSIQSVVNSDGSSEIDGLYWFFGKRDMFIVDSEESKDWMKLWIGSNIDAYAHNVRGASPKVAISFLLAYCIIALSHVLYAEFTGISSTCWDSIGKVTALPINSTRTILLKNACAGIMELNIFKLPVCVLAIRNS